MPDLKEKAFDFASETTKQLISLSTAIIGLTVTFGKDSGGSFNPTAQAWLVGVWVIFVLSIIFGILTMMALTGVLDPLTSQANQNPSINTKSIRLFSTLQILTFVLGLICACFFGYAAASTKKADATEKGHKILRSTQYGADSTIYRDTVLLPVK